MGLRCGPILQIMRLRVSTWSTRGAKLERHLHGHVNFHVNFFRRHVNFLRSDVTFLREGTRRRGGRLVTATRLHLRLEGLRFV